MTIKYRLYQTQYTADNKKHPCNLPIGSYRSSINSAFRYLEDFTTKFRDYEFELRETE